VVVFLEMLLLLVVACVVGMCYYLFVTEIAYNFAGATNIVLHEEVRIVA